MIYFKNSAANFFEQSDQVKAALPGAKYVDIILAPLGQPGLHFVPSWPNPRLKKYDIGYLYTDAFLA